MHHRHLPRDLDFAASAIIDILWLSRPVNPVAPTVFHCFGRKALLDDDCWLFRKNLILECAAISEWAAFIVSISRHFVLIPVFNFRSFHLLWISVVAVCIQNLFTSQLSFWTAIVMLNLVICHCISVILS